MRRTLAILLLMGAVVVPAIANAQVSYDDVETARQRVREVGGELEDEVAQYDAAVVAQIELQNRVNRLVLDLTARERELEAARRDARERAAAMYMTAGASSRSLIAVRDISSVPAKLAYLDSVTETDTDVVNRLDAARRDFQRQRTLLEGLLVDQELVLAELESLIVTIYSRLDEANEAYQEVKAAWDAQEAERIRREAEEAARQLFLSTSTTTSTTVAPPPTTTIAGTDTTLSGGDTTSTTSTDESTSTSTTVAVTTTVPPPPPSTEKSCPVDGATTFRDSWGEPRPGGRGHAGVDLLASRGTPLVAIEGGYIWSPNWHPSGGNGLYIKGDSGDLWYYAHLDGYAGGIVGGLRVESGQLVGYVGSTGNASVPHLHLGWQPGGGALDNPYGLLVPLCG